MRTEHVKLPRARFRKHLWDTYFHFQLKFVATRKDAMFLEITLSCNTTTSACSGTVRSFNFLATSCPF